MAVVLHSRVFVPHRVKIAHAWHVAESISGFSGFWKDDVGEEFAQEWNIKIALGCSAGVFQIQNRTAAPVGFSDGFSTSHDIHESIRKRISGFDLSDKKILRAGTMQDKNPSSPATQLHRFCFR